MNRLRTLTLSLVLAAAGCAQVMHQLNGGSGADYDHSPPGQGGAYVGAECGRWQAEDARSEGVFRSYDDQRRAIFKGDRRTSLSSAEGAMFLTCIHQTGGDGASSTDAIIADHFDFDDRHFDHVRAAAMVMDCAMNPECGVASNSRDIVGMMIGYSRRVDETVAAARLGDAGASQPLREAFAAKLLWARGIVEARVAAMDARRQALWAGVPQQVWTERADHFARYQKLYAALDPLLAIANGGDGDLADAAAKLRALRGKYLDACKVEGCLFTPFVLETTRALALIAVRQQDVPAALAESKLLDDDRLEAQLFSRAMLAALAPAAKREYETWQKFDRARRDGADAATLRAMFGEHEPIHISSDGPWITWGQRTIPSLTTTLDRDGYVRGGGNVRAIQRRGDRAVVVFADVVTKYEDADCHETNKIDGISSSGTIIYRQVCKNYRTLTERTKVDPIEIPAEEAASLRPGDLVDAWFTQDGRKGALIDAEREGMLVQVRGHRLRVKESPRDGDR